VLKIERITLDPKEAAKLIGINYKKIYELAHNDKTFPAIKFGRRIIIPKNGLLNWLEQKAIEE